MKRTWTGERDLVKHLVPCGALTLDPANLRLHGERSLEAIRGSLARFGQQRAIVVDPSGVVVAGNGTLAAARALGWTHIAAVRTQLAGPDRTAYAIADNRIAELSEWDQEALAKVLGSMTPDLAIAAGYTDNEIVAILKEAAAEPGQDDVPELAPAVSRRGDLWVLGEHRLLCGDSTAAADVDRVLDGELAAIVATDPPYLVDYTGSRPAKGKRASGKDWSDVYHEIDIKDAETFFTRTFSEIARVMAPHAALYCWHAHRRCGLLQAVWERLGLLDHQQLVWVKPSSVIGRVTWHFRHEPCMMGWRKGERPPHDNVHEFDSVWEVGWETSEGEGEKRKHSGEHPTQKPVELFARPIRKHTRPGDICYEPFSGSGTQIIACEQLRRRCRAIEIEPVFVDVAIRRWQLATNQRAVHAETGRAWGAEPLRRRSGRPGRRQAAGKCDQAKH